MLFTCVYRLLLSKSPKFLISHCLSFPKYRIWAAPLKTSSMLTLTTTSASNESCQEMQLIGTRSAIRIAIFTNSVAKINCLRWRMKDPRAQKVVSDPPFKTKWLATRPYIIDQMLMSKHRSLEWKTMTGSILRKTAPSLNLSLWCITRMLSVPMVAPPRKSIVTSWTTWLPMPMTLRSQARSTPQVVKHLKKMWDL